MKSNAERARRLVTFLGTGNYTETIYRFEGKRAERTRYVCRALAELLAPSEIVVLATDKATGVHGANLENALRSSGFVMPRFEAIPEGGEPGELWEQFETIKTALRGAAGPVMLDITHGFRSTPFFAAAVAGFTRAVDDNAPALRVCYAAPPEQGQNTPIWELSEFVSLLGWSQALAMFLRTGRAEEAATATEGLGRDLRKAWAQSGKEGTEPTLKQFGEALKRFGNDFETVRTGDLLIGRGGRKSSAAELLGAAERAGEEVRRHAPPLADILDRVVELAEPLAVEQVDLSGEAGRNAVAALARIYLRLGRYVEAAATVREGWINFHAAKSALSPGAPDFDAKERACAEERTRRSEKRFKAVTERRNDLLHAQYKRDSATQDGRSIINTMSRSVEDFAKASRVAQGQIAPSLSAKRTGVFVNLSNHPKSHWTGAQTEAASAFGEGIRIEDICFPAVPPDADEARVYEIAEECVALFPPDATHALVQGEFTLTIELVGRLQARGIVCFAATSAREVEAGEGGKRVSSFKFVRFRRYPQLRSG